MEQVKKVSLNMEFLKEVYLLGPILFVLYINLVSELNFDELKASDIDDSAYFSLTNHGKGSL